MKDEERTKEQLLNELKEIRERIAQFENLHRQKQPEQSDRLRKEAEKRIESALAAADETEAGDATKLVHELRVYQIEIELQNEELRKALRQLEESRTKYADLYDFSPVCYLTLDEHGVVNEANLTAAQQLGVERGSLISIPLSKFMVRGDAAKFHHHLKEVFDSGKRHTCEVRLREEGGAHFHAQFDSMPVQDSSGKKWCRTSFMDITDRKRMEEGLLRSEEKYRLVVENAGEAILIAQGGMLKFVNSRTSELLGYSEQSVISKPFTEFVHPEDRQMVLDRHMRRLQGEKLPRVYPFRIVTKDGAVKWVEIHAVVILWERKPATLNFLDDITDRKRAEEELDRYRDHLEDLVKERTATLAAVNEQLTCEIEERKKVEQALCEWQLMLQSVLDTIPVRVFWKDLASDYLGCNRSFALDAGLHFPEELIGRNDYEMGWAEQAELYRSDDRLVIETGRPKLGYEEPQTTPDGGRIWLRTNKVPLLDSAGRIKGVLGTYEDITKSKEMEEALRASETKYRIVADNTYDWEYWVSPERRFLYTSPSCQRITGYTVSEFEADPRLISQVVHPDDLAQFEAHLEQAQTTGAPCELEFRIIHRDGTTRWIGHACQPVFDAHGSFLGCRGSNRDITDHKQAEQALQESSEKLKLFAYSVAHDLKSPAIGVYGLSKRLSKAYKDVLDEKGRGYCDQIVRASEHIAALVDKVNVYIATKEARPSIERISIAEILQMLKDEFSAHLSIRQIDWVEPEAEVEINADRLSMLRVFRNFVDNSLKYGGEKLSRIWTGYEESEDFHIFSFSDNGKGLKEEDSERIFGAFQRNATSRGVEGAGLGLTIVKEIAEQHGGKVWVEPRTKKGITFFISISKNL
jgi:PAS domain S-box-containing protein